MRKLIDQLFRLSFMVHIRQVLQMDLISYRFTLMRKMKFLHTHQKVWWSLLSTSTKKKKILLSAKYCK